MVNFGKMTHKAELFKGYYEESNHIKAWSFEDFL